jgi:hypothetical protein
MQLLPSMMRIRQVAALSSMASMAIIILAVASCRKTIHRDVSSPVHVSLCEIYDNPAAYDGKIVTVTATVTQLPDGQYVYPGTPNECGGFSLIKLDAQSLYNETLKELESSKVPGRKEFDLELTGTFDSKYAGGWDWFRYRIVPIEIKPRSPIRTGQPLGAA